MPRRRLAFAVRVGLPRATMNAPWRRLLPGLGGTAVMMGPASRFQAREAHALDPRQLWVHLRTTNPIESTSSTVH